MSHSADQQSRSADEQQNRNNSNLVDSAAYYDYSSMAALASAAGIQGHQPGPDFNAADIGPTSTFADIDSQLQLYEDIPNASSHTYQDLIETGAIDGSNHVSTYSGSNTSVSEWYPSLPAQINNMPSFVDNFSHFSDFQSSPNVVQSGEAQKGGQLTAPSGVNGDGVPGKQASLKVRRSTPITPDPKPSEVKVTETKTSALSPSQKVSKGSSSPTSGNQPIRDKDQPLASLGANAEISHSKIEIRPRSSVPLDIAVENYAQQCILAAYASRLNPFALHPDEHKLLRTHINQIQITIYLNIRNAILRLWTRNPLVSVTREEAAGCTKDYRWFQLADVAYEWLSRHGYINFGCVDIPLSLVPSLTASSAKSKRQKTIVVIGAGMAGLGCSRQLKGLFDQHEALWSSKFEDPPKIVILEGRKRIGGRVFSRLLSKQDPEELPSGTRSTAEMGAQIITGFDHGNPLSAIIRGQLALAYHPIKDNSILYDFDGTPVEKSQDTLVEKLYNNILDKASVYRHKITPPKTVDGDKDLIASWKDPAGEGGRPISVMEDAAARIPVARGGFDTQKNGIRHSSPVASVDRLTGKANVSTVPNAYNHAHSTPQIEGWDLKPNNESKAINLDGITKAEEYPSLGTAMDEAVRQYQDILNITPQDMRLLNWHFANLEYANAVNLDQLSLSGWDLDIGNEFEGEHSEIVGGYSQVPYGIWTAPNRLDVRFGKIVKHVHHDAALASNDAASFRIDCNDGETIEADRVVLTVPLGVLKSQSIEFSPPLPDWKSGSVDRLGFGTLNKVVLVYEQAFWDVERDMFGYLREPHGSDPLSQDLYHVDRGRLYIFWNCVKTSGKPMLVALMAGDAALAAESSKDQSIIQDATDTLRKIFESEQVPSPTETIITRWSKDPFSRGSYSYVGPRARADDYDTMAKPIGDLYFAGEATCGTHPATVHGAYLSGLRAASEVFTSLAGPIAVPKPLIPAKTVTEVPTVSPVASKKRKAQSDESRLQELQDARNEAYEINLRKHVTSKIGEQPAKPGRTGVNPFLLYQKDHWHICKQQQDQQRQQATGDPNAKAQRNDVRAALGKMWREATEDERRPYLDRTKDKKEQNESDSKAFSQKIAEWSQEADRVAVSYRETYPNKPSAEEQQLQQEVEAKQQALKKGRPGA